MLFTTGVAFERLLRERGQHRGRRDLAVLVRHVPRLRHQRRDLDRVAEHVNARHVARLERQEVDLAPLIVDGDDARIAGDRGLRRAAESR